MEQGRKFKAMFSSLGLSVVDVANFLQVSPRTVQLWVSGRVRIPYAAYKLMRLQLRYELPGQAWKDWHISAGRLYTPEGHEFDPKDFSWWSLLVRRAAMFGELYRKQTTDCAADTRRRAELAMHERQEAAAQREVLVTPHSSPENRNPAGKRDVLVTRPGSLTGETKPRFFPQCETCKARRMGRKGSPQ